MSMIKQALSAKTLMSYAIKKMRRDPAGAMQAFRRFGGPNMPANAKAIGPYARQFIKNRQEMYKGYSHKVKPGSPLKPLLWGSLPVVGYGAYKNIREDQATPYAVTRKYTPEAMGQALGSVTKDRIHL